MKERIKQFPDSFPIIFSAVIFAVGLGLAIVFMDVCQFAGVELSDSTCLGRILAGVLLAALFIGRLYLRNSFRGFLICLPMYGLALFNVINHYLTGGGAPNPLTLSLLLTGIAPGVFEEIIFRGIAISALRRKFGKPIVVVLISAVVFSLSHLTNLVGMYWLQVMIQLLHALVVGIVLGAVYYISGDLISCILAHAVIDITSYMFSGGEDPITWYLLTIFIIFMVAEIVYGVVLACKKSTEIDDEGNAVKAPKKGTLIAIGALLAALIVFTVAARFIDSKSLTLSYYMEDGPWQTVTTQDKVKVSLDGEYLVVKVTESGVYTVHLESDDGRSADYVVEVDRENVSQTLTKISEGD